MKDKRQRIAVAWPYAAVYSDPAFAASILQAAANSVGFNSPYGYGANPMLPQMPVIPSQLPHTPNHFSSYGYRYAPYPIPPRSSQLPTNPSYSSMLNGMPQGYGSLGMPKTHTPPHDMQSPGSPHSTSLSPGSDKVSNHSPIKSLNTTPQGLLMTASPNGVSTTVLTTPDKPKLFKPYKSES